MDEEASCSKRIEQNSDADCENKKRQKRRKMLTSEEKVMIRNVYKGIVERKMVSTVSEAIDICSSLTKVCVRSVYSVLKNTSENKTQQKVETRGRKNIVLDDETRNVIRRKIHSFYFRSEIPTLQKISQELENDDRLPRISRRVLIRTLREMNFRYSKRNRKSMLVEKNEIILWRRKYLEEIRNIRSIGRKIYYLDETWINEGHTVAKVWQDLNIKSKREAFIEGFSTGLKAPSGKGRRLIITHIGSDTGFLDDGLLQFQSCKTGDYHEEMTAEVFERWFKTILTKLEPGSVVVMDNAPYHSRRLEQLPTTAWRKGRIQEWLTEKGIAYEEPMLKTQLLEIARLRKIEYVKYAVDETAKDYGVKVLRLPPYHCELNPIELIWAQVKGEVARNNKTFKLNEMKELLTQAILHVTPEKWAKCIGHIVKEENRMWELDTCIEVLIEPIIIRAGEDNDSDSSTASSDPDNA